MGRPPRRQGRLTWLLSGHGQDPNRILKSGRTDGTLNRESLLAPLFHEVRVGWSTMTKLSHFDDWYGALRNLPAYKPAYKLL